MSLKVLIITVRSSKEDSSINEIKNIDANRKGLIRLFKKQNPKSISNPKLAAFGIELKSFINEITNDDTFLVYYAGHGLKDQKDRRVYLETNESKRTCIADTSYPITTFVNRIRNSVAKRKIIIIDSCYSGAAHAHDNTMGLDDGDNDDFLKEHIENSSYKGVYILTSTKPNELALFPNDTPNEPTFFTGELLSIFNNGLKDVTKERINCNDLFNELTERLKKKHLPEPCQSNDGNVQDLPFWPNKSYKKDNTESTKTKTDNANLGKNEIPNQARIEFDCVWADFVLKFKDIYIIPDIEKGLNNQNDSLLFKDMINELNKKGIIQDQSENKDKIEFNNKDKVVLYTYNHKLEISSKQGYSPELKYYELTPEAIDEYTNANADYQEKDLYLKISNVFKQMFEGKIVCKHYKI